MSDKPMHPLLAKELAAWLARAPTEAPAEREAEMAGWREQARGLERKGKAAKPRPHGHKKQHRRSRRRARRPPRG